MKSPFETRSGALNRRDDNDGSASLFSGLNLIFPSKTDEGDDELASIKILIDGLQNDDSVLRLKAIRRLATIATALGPDRTREELIPFLNRNFILF